MGMIVKIPLLNVNDDSVMLVVWTREDVAPVRKGETICTVETTKSAVDLCAEADGFLRQIEPAGVSYSTGHAVGFIAETLDEPIPALQVDRLVDDAAVNGVGNNPAWTKKAQILAARLGVDLSALVQAHPGVTIREEHVKRAAEDVGSSHSVAEQKQLDIIATPSGMQERILILGGGGGGALVIDILWGSMTQRAVGIVDNNPALTGTDLDGVPILGSFELVEKLWKDKKFDKLISTIVRDTADRKAVFDRFIGLGIPFANVISPGASIRTQVKMGTGNLIIHGSYVATGVTMGNNNFLAAGTYIEHHSTIGNHCTFGPRTSLSGRVKVEDGVKFGMNVAIEPFVEIGSGALIASGVTLTSHVPAKSVVKNTQTPVIRVGKHA